MQNAVEREVILSEGETFFVDETWLTHMTPKLVTTTARLVADLVEHERIIQVTSIAGHIGPAGRAPYAAAKFGVEGFSESLLKEIGTLGIKVTIN